MNELLFLCPWDIPKITSWSGTHFALLKALSSYYNIIDYPTKHQTLIDAIENKLNYITRKTIGNSDMGISRREREGRKIKHLEYDGRIFSFEESPILEGCRQYVYQDLYIKYLLDLYYDNHSLFKQSGFGGISLKGLTRRVEIQSNYYKYVDGIFTMGEWLKDYLIKCNPSLNAKVHHVGGGYNIDITKINNSLKQGNKILFVGKAFKRKNGYLVVDAFKKARKKRKDIWLYIVGPENLPYDKNDNIICLGNLNFSMLPEVFNMCDVFCMPSLFEAYGLVFTEALSFGLPCIGNACFEMPYFIEDNQTGYLLKNNSSDELAVMMLELLSSNDIRKNVIDRREYYINKYSWNTVASRIAKIIN